ncbi:MAG TPA: hypothetical protein VFV83_08960 [Chthoniobacteraceae bacterium]|nr:hypothetical protein [Chthoniobacteraceae bacterium]
MTPSQSRILQDLLDQRALMRHARGRAEASWRDDENAPLARAPAFFDLLGWLALEALYAQSLATFLGICRVANARPKLMRSPASERVATLEDLGVELLDPAALGSDRTEILWDGLDCAANSFAIVPRLSGGHLSDAPWERQLAHSRTTIRRFSLLVDELVSRELP